MKKKANIINSFKQILGLLLPENYANPVLYFGFLAIFIGLPLIVIFLYTNGFIYNHKDNVMQMYEQKKQEVREKKKAREKSRSTKKKSSKDAEKNTEENKEAAKKTRRYSFDTVFIGEPVRSNHTVSSISFRFLSRDRIQ